MLYHLDFRVEYSASIGEARRVAAQEPENIRRHRGRNCHVEPQQISQGLRRKVLESGNDARGNAGQKHGDEIGARLRVSG